MEEYGKSKEFLAMRQALHDQLENGTPPSQTSFASFFRVTDGLMVFARTIDLPAEWTGERGQDLYLATIIHIRTPQDFDIVALNKTHDGMCVIPTEPTNGLLVRINKNPAVYFLNCRHGKAFGTIMYHPYVADHIFTTESHARLAPQVLAATVRLGLTELFAVGRERKAFIIGGGMALKEHLQFQRHQKTLVRRLFSYVCALVNLYYFNCEPERAYVEDPFLFLLKRDIQKGYSLDRKVKYGYVFWSNAFPDELPCRLPSLSWVVSNRQIDLWNALVAHGAVSAKTRFDLTRLFFPTLVTITGETMDASELDSELVRTALSFRLFPTEEIQEAALKRTTYAVRTDAHRLTTAQTV